MQKYVEYLLKNKVHLEMSKESISKVCAIT